MAGINEQVSSQLLFLAIDLNRLGEGLVQKALTELLRLQEELRREIKLIDQNATGYGVRRTNALLSAISKIIDKHYGRIETETTSSLVSVGEYAAETYARTANKIFGTELLSIQTTLERIKAIVNTTPLQGNPASAWWKKQVADTTLRFNSQMRMGLLAQETNEQLVTRVLGQQVGSVLTQTTTGRVRVPLYAQGVLDVSRKDASSIVRTHTQTVSNNAIQSVVEENQDIIKGQKALVTLDGRTSDICRARSGGCWFSDGTPMPESTVQIPFPGPPPWHYNCRTILVPVFKSWAELASEAGANADVIAALKATPEFQSTQSSMDGQVPGDLNYEKWFSTKPVAFQKEVLGPSKYELWSKGKLSFADMVSPSGRPLTVKELRAKVE